MKTLLLLFTLTVSSLLHCNAQDMVNVNEVIVNYFDRGFQTDYFLISNLKGNINVNDAWVSVGLNGEKQMVVIKFQINSKNL